MSYSLFAFYEAPGERSPILAGHFRELSEQEPVSGFDVDLFLPEPKDVLLFDDGPGPVAILEFSCKERVRLEALVRDGAFRQGFAQTPLTLVPDVSMAFGLFRSLPSPVAGEDEVSPRTAGLSFVVRYYGPMPNATAFQDFYTAKHPPILGRLPAIRNVFCYLPEEFDGASLPPSKVMLINEVVFDDVEHLNAALRSDVVRSLRADSRQFPPFGHSTHHAMRRETLLSKASD